jgi:hypothetical protein
MSPSEESYVGSQLDEHHAPETNGRMSVCRRCGTQTDSPAGRHHLPNERQIARSNSWLVTQAQSRRIDDLRERNTK